MVFKVTVLMRSPTAEPSKSVPVSLDSDPLGRPWFGVGTLVSLFVGPGADGVESEEGWWRFSPLVAPPGREDQRQTLGRVCEPLRVRCV